MVAFVPGFSFEREAAVSQAEAAGATGAGVEDGSTVVFRDGVEVGAIIFAPVAEGEGVRGDATILVMVNMWVGEASGVLVGSGSFVAVGVERTTVVLVEVGSDVTVDSEISVTVGEEGGVRDTATIFVTVSVWVAADVAVDETEVNEAGIAGEFAPGGLAPGAGVVEGLGTTVEIKAGD